MADVRELRWDGRISENDCDADEEHGAGASLDLR